MLCAPDVAAERLVEKAVCKGKRNQDNVTVLAMDYSPAAERTKTKHEDIDAGNAFMNKLHINQLKKNSMEIFFNIFYYRLAAKTLTNPKTGAHAGKMKVKPYYVQQC